MKFKDELREYKNYDIISSRENFMALENLRKSMCPFGVEKQYLLKKGGVFVKIQCTAVDGTVLGYDETIQALEEFIEERKKLLKEFPIMAESVHHLETFKTTYKNILKEENTEPTTNIIKINFNDRWARVKREKH